MKNDNKMESCPGECDIINMDHIKFAGEDKVPTEMVNRACRSCNLHWYGKKGEVKKYTGEEWYEWISGAFQEEVENETA